MFYLQKTLRLAKKMEIKLGKSQILFKKMFIKKVKNFSKYLILFLVVTLPSNTRAEFFEDLSKIIEDNKKRLSYGISVTDFNMDGNYEFLVTGFGFPNLALSYQDGKLKDLNQQKIFSDASKKTIGVAACDIDKDGFEEIYFLKIGRAHV